MNGLPEPMGELGYLKHNLFKEYHCAVKRGDFQGARYLSRVMSECWLHNEYFDWVEKTYGKEQSDGLRDAAQKTVQSLLKRG